MLDRRTFAKGLMGAFVGPKVALQTAAMTAVQDRIASVSSQSTVRRPVPQPTSWQIAANPDLGSYTAPNQQVVDFAIWQAADTTWQLWSCIRNTKVPGATRLFYRWEGRNLEDPAWRPVGIAQMTQKQNGEWEGSLQAPYVVKSASRWYMFYGSGGRIFLQTSNDGKNFTRWSDSRGRSWLFGQEQGDGPRERDPMVLRANGRWHIYYTGNPNDQGVVYVRTSTDLTRWTEASVVAFGGRAGTGRYSAECPHVMFRHGRFYLFRTQDYGEKAQTMVYQSSNPMMFGVNQDEQFYVSSLTLAAPEIVQHKQQDFIGYLEPSLNGIRLAKLDWTLS